MEQMEYNPVGGERKKGNISQAKVRTDTNTSQVVVRFKHATHPTSKDIDTDSQSTSAIDALHASYPITVNLGSRGGPALVKFPRFTRSSLIHPPSHRLRLLLMVCVVCKNYIKRNRQQKKHICTKSSLKQKQKQKYRMAHCQLITRAARESSTPFAFTTRQTLFTASHTPHPAYISNGSWLLASNLSPVARRVNPPIPGPRG
jgi:hypothetical protein